MYRLIPAVIASTLLASAALAQSNVTLDSKFAWSENCGWINFRDAGSPVAAQGVRLSGSVLSGFAFGENIGFINFGSGAPANGAAYANSTSGSVAGVPDFGVNRDPITNMLSGFAWSENVGWINFGAGALATPANPARIDLAARRVRGYAWSENVGWISLDATDAFVSFCQIDFDGNGVVNLDDIFTFLSSWFARDPRCDFDGQFGVNLDDVFIYINAWFAGC